MRTFRRPGSARVGTLTTSIIHADFDQAYDPINPNTPGGSPQSYTVRGGETLESIASLIWGDPSLWYMIAEANGLSSSSQISAGQVLIIPNKVANFHNTASTFRPYDPAQAIGDTQPTTPKPPKKPKCGVFGAILLAVIAIAVAAVTAGAALVAMGQAATLWTGIVAAATLSAPLGSLVVAGAVGGAVGSIVSQGIGVATGLQDRFSWKAVGLAAIGGGVGAGVSGLNKFAFLGKIGSAVANGVVSSAITQGIGVATGLQDKFSWAGVAAAGVAAGVGAFVGDKLKLQSLSAGDGLTASNIAKHVVTGAARMVASAATRSLIEGTNFGDNIVASLPDVVAQTVTDLIFGAITGEEERKAMREGIERIRGLEGFENRPKEDLIAAYKNLRSFDALNDDESGAALSRVEGSSEAQKALADVVDLQNNSTYFDPVSDNEIVVTAQGDGPTKARRTVEEGLEITERAFVQVGGLSPEDAAAAMADLRQDITESQTEVAALAAPISLASRGIPRGVSLAGKPWKPAAGSFAIDSIVMGAGRTLERVQKTFDENPWAAWTLEGIAFVASPAKYFLGKLVGKKLTEPAVNYVAGKAYDRATGSGYSQNNSKSFAIGAVAIASTLVGLAVAGPRRVLSLFSKGKQAVQTAVRRADGKLFGLRRAVQGADMTGARAEGLVRRMLRSGSNLNPLKGFRIFDGKIRGNQGFDNIAIKYGPDGNPVAISVVEVKNGATALGSTNSGTQMGTPWVDATIAKMVIDKNPEARRIGQMMQDFRDSNRSIGREIARVQTDGTIKWVPHNKLPR